MNVPAVPDGYPGIDPRWTSSAKCGVGTAANPRSRIWFTISHGIINECYYPRVDLANTRDCGLIVTDGVSYFSEEKRNTIGDVALIAPGVPGYRLTNAAMDGRYQIIKTVVTDPYRDVLLQEVRFEPLQGNLADYRMYVLLAPHIRNQGRGNTGWVADYKGVPMLFAQREDCTLALAASVGFAAASCGYVGVSDGWQDLYAHKRLTRQYSRVEDGNIALTAEVDLAACGGRFVLSLAFGHTSAEAGQDARAGLLQDFDEVAAAYVSEWQAYQAECMAPEGDDADEVDEYRTSIAVLKTHEDKDHPGAVIASLSVPWGNYKGDHDLGGYHLVWPRDLVASVTGLLAAGDAESPRRALHYLMCTQEADGHWAQNMWLDGRPYWNGVQMDETAFPILLADALRREGALGSIAVWPMARKAASYIVSNGPVTPQDRWEERAGYSPFTIAVQVAALIAAARLADMEGDHASARYLRETADEWNQNVERWTYVEGSATARRVGVAGYYARITAGANASGTGDPEVSPDALALVRYGLRAADDPRIANTVAVIDALLRRETVTGPVWHRYNGDRYGEYDDGAPYDGNGAGRGWPLLAGERGHYELAAGRPAEARRLLRAMRAQTNPGGLIPEQVWDAPDIAHASLFNGFPTGAAMPLAWAHAEYIKLERSLSDGRVFDTPPQTMQRYVEQPQPARYATWRFNHQVHDMPVTRTLRIQTPVAARVHWSAAGWQGVHDALALETPLGVWYADLPTTSMPAGTVLHFTIFWVSDRRWEGTDFEIVIREFRDHNAESGEILNELVRIAE